MNASLESVAIKLTMKRGFNTATFYESLKSMAPATARIDGKETGIEYDVELVAGVEHGHPTLTISISPRDPEITNRYNSFVNSDDGASR